MSTIEDSSDTIDSEKNAPANSEVLTEPTEEQKIEIAGWVADGMGLSDVQKKINTDFGVVMTYIDVRFLVDDLDLTLTDKEEIKPKETTEDPANDEAGAGAALAPAGVSVEVDPVTPPGAMASGSVTFSDGENKKWSVDQFGRLGLSGGDESYKPSDEDVMEFQKQLDASLRGRGL
ncbi:MAG: hypothetical protein P8N49_09240 [Opitutales bacterium]|nr:hypothetical protein [Opitutales bacterium]